MNVAAIIVNYMTPELTIGAVRSCLEEPGVGEVIVVDNASADGSAAAIKSAIPDGRLRVIESPDNGGFGRANNLGVRESNCEYVFLLNSDAYALPGAVGRLVARLESDPTIGIAGPEVLLRDGTTPQPLNFGPFPTLRTLLIRDQTVRDSQSPDWISGVAMLARRDLMLDLGGFDDRYFMYFEDVDLCRRVRAAGKKIVRVPEAKIVHLGGQSLSSEYKRKKLYYASQDRYLASDGISAFGLALVKATRWPAYFARSLRR